MKLHEERTYLNTFSVWGAKQHDPARTEHIKSVDPIYNRRVFHGFRVFAAPTTSRFLSAQPSTYLT